MSVDRQWEGQENLVELGNEILNPKEKKPGQDRTIKIKERLKSLIEKYGNKDKKEKQLEGIENNTPEQLLIKTTDFYNSFYGQQNFKRPFGIKTIKDASTSVFSIEIEGDPDNIFEELEGEKHESEGRLVGNLLLATEQDKDPLVISNQILNILERFISWKEEQTKEKPETNS